jgi:hypothetical protein
METMSNKHTPIEQWIEEKSNDYSNAFYYGTVKNAYSSACIDLLDYLGLQDIVDPKNNIRHLEFRANEGLEISKEFEDFKENVERLSLKYSFKIESLEAENEKLKEALKEISNIFKPKELSIWDFVEEVRNKAKEALKDDQEPPTWEARDAWEGGFADNH